MKKQEIDHILTRMLGSYDNVSDLNITVGKPFQVESAGELKQVELNPEFKEITAFQSEVFAMNLIRQDRRLTETLLTNPNMFGFCYTQLYDIELEVNGLYTYDRRAKFDPEIIRRINTQRAAFEDRK